MQPPQSETKPQPRRLACARCGAEFSCSLQGGCWCAAEPYRLPLPASTGSNEDCLCPACLKKAAEAGSTGAAR